MIYGKGYRPSDAHKQGLGHPSHLSALTVPDAAEVELGPVVDQLRSSSCTGNSSAVAIQAKMPKVAGQWAELPSRLFLYAGARALIGEEDRDEGAQIADIFETARKLGVCRESVWPFSDDLARVTKQPDILAFHDAADQKIISGAYRIGSTGTQRVLDVKAALASGNPVVWGSTLDQAFEDLQPGQVWPGVAGEPVGGHAMVIFAHAPWLPGKSKFKTRSSWSADWCEDGSAWISQDAVASFNASDFWVVSVIGGYSA